MLKRIALLAVWMLAACRPPGAVCEGDCGGGKVTEPTEKPAAPLQVTGLRASRASNGVTLTWKKSTGAQGYEVYREEAVIPNAPLLSASLHTFQRTPLMRRAGRVPGTRLGSSTKTTLTDTSAREGYEYTYRIVAFNKLGDAPASAPAKIKLYPAGLDGWVSDWLQAPANSGTGGGAPFDWSDAIGTAGGDAGVTSTTTFPDVAADFAGCAPSGAGITAVRPAIDTLLAEAPQTFALELTYNTGGADWSYFVGAFGYGTGYTPIYSEEGVLAGCGKKAVQFTVDTALLPQSDVYVYVQVFDGFDDLVAFDLWAYRSANAAWVRITSTTPAKDALLTTSGMLEVNLEYHNVVTQTIGVMLMPADAWDLSFGTAATQVAGSGTVTVTLPYHIVCGYSTAALYLEMDADVVSPNYGFAVSTSETYQLLALREGWVRRGDSFFTTDVWALKCGGAETVTLTAPPGWQVGVRDPDTWDVAWAQSLTALSGENFELRAVYSFLSGLPYGTAVSSLTATFSGATITAPVTVNVYELFWQTAPPASAVGDAPYAVAVTIAGPRPTSTVYVDIRNEDLPLSWQAERQAFAGAVSYPTCGVFDNAVSDYEGYLWDVLGGNWWDNPYATEVTVAARLVVQHDSWLYFDAGLGEVGPTEIPLWDSCGKPFHWQIVGAPTWLRFEALAGTQAAPPRMGLLTSVAFSADDYNYGTVEVMITETGEILEVDVSAWN